MSQFEMENRDLFQMVNENHRRSNLTTTVGFFVPEPKARQFAKFEKAEQIRKRNRKQNRDMAAAIVVTLFVAVCGILIPLIF